MGRFLTDRSPFANIAPVLGALEYVGRDGAHTALAVAQRFVRNQGSFWSYTLEYLDRHLARGEPAADAAAADDPHALYAVQARTLGARVGEMHVAFARTTGDPDFDPEPVSEADLAAWARAIHEDAIGTLDELERRRSTLDEDLRLQADRLLAHRAGLLARTDTALPPAPGLVKTRYHGDLHFGQVLVTGNDVVIIDFEGEPMRSIAQRRSKHSPLRDLAGLLRSASYAAHTVVARRASSEHERGGELDRLAAEWERGALSALRLGYAGAVAALPSVPGAAESFDAWLDRFLIEKALYEIRYELEHRPRSTAIPVRGLIGLMERNEPRLS